MVDELTHLLQNPAHWIYEGITDVAFSALAFGLSAILPERFNPVKRWVARHDKEHHKDV